MDDSALSDDLQDLVEYAQAAAANAYAPYSHFPVGAALLASDGTVTIGANVENASYGLGICAERSAMVAAVSAGHRSFRAIAVYVDGPDGQPCGACRQFLAEFGLDLTVIHKSDGQMVAVPLAALLPNAFVPSALPST